MCDRLRKAYTGDFLADLLHDSPEEVGTWARRPFTLYRDYFLQAVLYAAEYELRAGQQLANEHLDDEGEAAEEQRRRQRAHYSRAAQLYRTYAMRACDSRFDLKVTFGGSGRAHGERVDMSERAAPLHHALWHSKQHEYSEPGVQRLLQTHEDDLGQGLGTQQRNPPGSGRSAGTDQRVSIPYEGDAA